MTAQAVADSHTRAELVDMIRREVESLLTAATALPAQDADGRAATAQIVAEGIADKIAPKLEGPTDD